MPKINNLLPAAVVLLVVMILALLLGYKQGFDYGMTGDSAVYLLLAESMSPYYTAEADLYSHLLGQHPFPPLFPGVLAMLGGGAHSALASSIINSVVFVFAIGACYAWGKSVLGSWKMALAAMVLLVLMPNTSRQFLVIQSEHLYLMLLMSGLWFQQKPYSEKSDYIGTILFMLATLTRTIGLLAVVVHIAGFWSRRDVKMQSRILMLAVLPVLIWMMYARSQGASSGYLSIFASAMEGNVIENLSSQMSVNLKLMSLYWVRCFHPAMTAYSAYVVWTVSLFMLAGLLYRLYKLRPDAIYVLLYFMVLLIWPYPAQLERFFYLLMPFALVYGLYTGLLMGNLFAGKTVMVYSGVYFLAILLVLLPTLAGMLRQYEAGASLAHDQVRTIEWLQSTRNESVLDSQLFMQRIYQFIRDTRALVPANACVITTAPTYYMLHARRAGIKPAHTEMPDQQFRQSVSRCDYVFMLAATPRPSLGNPPMYPYRRIRGMMSVLAVIYVEPGNSDSNVAAMLVKI